jgi:hypothetical protein
MQIRNNAPIQKMTVMGFICIFQAILSFAHASIVFIFFVSHVRYLDLLWIFQESNITPTTNGKKKSYEILNH